MELKDAIKNTKEPPQKRAHAWIVLFCLTTMLSHAFGHTQQTDTLKLTLQQYEEVFLKQNLLLIAEKYHIDQANALFLQAKLWPNPSISIDEVNLWSTSKQLTNLTQPLPQVFGSIAKNTQFSAQIEQVIQTAGKRKKGMALEQVSVDRAQQEFEEVLRSLKFELRTNLHRLQYLQHYKQVYRQQEKSVKGLLTGYQRQVEQQNVSQAEFMRLQVLQLDLAKQINALNKESNEVETDLKILLHIPDACLYVLVEDAFQDIQAVKKKGLAALYDQALTFRPDLIIAHLENAEYAQRVQYEQAQRIPNLSLKSSYDRGSNIWPSFLGFGLTIDLPLFDRNQGNIKHAKLGMEQTKVLMEEKRFRVQAEVSKSYKDFLVAASFYESIDSRDEQQLDTLLTHFTRNFANRDISLLDYLDFQSAYLNHKKIILESRRDLHLHLEELQYIIGKEIE